jgi:hypothetical protein
MGRHKIDREPKRKAVKVRLCERLHSGKVVEPYRIMEEIVAGDRQDLADIKIGIAWHTGWRPDADGVRTFGKCAKRGDLDRAMNGFDFLIILNEQAWGAFSDDRKRRLIYHELEHAQVCRDKNGAPMFNDKSRVVTRVKKHDVGDFRCVIEKFGLPENLTDIQIADSDRPLLAFAEAKQKTPKSEKAAAGETACVKVSPGLMGPDTTEERKLKFKGLKGCKGLVSLRCKEGQWYGGYALHLGNLSIEEAPTDTQACSSRVEALQAAQTALDIWLTDLIVTGTADAKRAMLARRDMMREQLDQQLDPILNAAEEDALYRGRREEPEEA